MFTPTQRRILTLLKDGMPHSKQAIFECLEDELAAPTAVNVHLSRLRVPLRRIGQDIICELVNRRIHYRRVRLFREDS